MLRDSYTFAKKHSLLGVTFQGLKSFDVQGSESSDRELYIKWAGIALRIKERNIELNRQCLILQSKIAEYNVRSSILKGQGIAQLYPRELSYLRQPGDIDIYVDCGMEKAFEIASHFDGKIVSWDFKHIHLRLFHNIDVEIHYRAMMLLNPWKNTRLQKYFKANEERFFLGTVDLPGCGKIVVPDSEFNVFLILLHLYQHLFGDGIGFRQLMDLNYVLRNARVSDKLKTEVKSFGLDKFACGLMWALGESYDFPEPEMPWKPDRKEGEFLLNFIYNCGNFGHRSKGNRIMKLVHIMSTNCNLFTHYTVDTLSVPFYYIWHYIWKRVYACRHKVRI